MAQLFDKKIRHTELQNIKFNILPRPKDNKILNLDLKDSIKIEKTNRECTIYLTRYLTTVDKTVFEIEVTIKSVKILLDENIEISKIKEYLAKNIDNELQNELVQLSLLITQNTLFTPLNGVVTPNTYFGKI